MGIPIIPRVTDAVGGVVGGVGRLLRKNKLKEEDEETDRLVKEYMASVPGLANVSSSAQLNLMGEGLKGKAELSVRGTTQWLHRSKWDVDKVDSRDRGTPDEWIQRHPELIRLTGRHPFNCEPPPKLLNEAGFLTPASIHYVRNHGAAPNIKWNEHRIRVEGNVPRVRTFSMNDIVNMPRQSIPVTLVCAGNRRKEENMLKQTIGFNWGQCGVGTSMWTGVPMHVFLKICGVTSVSANRQYLCFQGPDGELPKGKDGSYGTSIPLAMALNPANDVMIAYEQNAKKLTPDHGYPVRIIIPGWIGGRMVKYLTKISVTATPSENFYHFNDNRIMPPHVDAEMAAAEGWWYKEEYIFNQLNINSAILYPDHDQVVKHE
eukprot:CAMPEP_0118926636 /NCGR_PEP_ID=MMETSP1169-20130426/4281_1 /TAXON_ID=36882 /ORGANISM="Pyramimonas obovata, Strain CCMP722" /LENGTH=374 /DNA_ID=CAMNT_0006868229 /DNA_START=150 /DNA_END=1271 /DNA_ORIENTATION=-